MNTAVLITLIICSTLIVLFLIALIGGSKTTKRHRTDDFSKNDFPPADMWGTKEGRN